MELSKRMQDNCRLIASQHITSTGDLTFKGVLKAVEYAVDNIDKWIKISEKLPEHNNRIMTYDGQFVQEGYYSFTEKRIVVPSFKHHNTITHWQPLPDAPSCT